MSKALVCEMFTLVHIISHSRGQRQGMSVINEIKNKNKQKKKPSQTEERRFQEGVSKQI